MTSVRFIGRCCSIPQPSALEQSSSAPSVLFDPRDDLMRPIDPVTVSVVQHRLRAIVEEMGEAMLRTSYSQILNSSRDFSTALCDVQARLIAQADHIPVHVGALPYAARAVTEFFQGDIHPGDMFLLNDPYHG